MRITFVMPGWAWKPAGGYRTVYALASELARRGHQLAVVHPRDMPADALPAANAELRLRRRLDRMRNRVMTPRVGWEQLDTRVRMLYVPDLDEQHIPDGDVLIATFWSTAEAVLACSARKGAHAYFVQSYESWGGPQERVDATWRAPMFKLVIAVWLLERGIALGVDPSSMAHVPIAIDHDVFRTVSDIESRAPRVATLYASAPGKGFDVALRALHRARARVPSMTAVAFGTERAPTGLPDWIEYRRNPPQQALAVDVYNSSAAYLCASWLEGWHLPPAEAMACGCALVSSDIGGVRDYAQHDETALLAPAGDDAALGDALARVLTDTALRMRIARSGGERIRRFRWDASADALLEALHARFGSVAGA